MRTFILLTYFLIGSSIYGLSAQEADSSVERVLVVFKTHLDIGYTDLSSRVERHYIDTFIPKALAVAEELRAAGGEERYVWTTGSWLIWAYLHQASPEQVRRLEEGIRQGDIVWNGMPYTVESEVINGPLFEGILDLSEWLDRRYGKQTRGAKMTDVPGHTRSIVPLLSRAGIRFLHIGVNGATPVPKVPELCRWRDTDGSEVILMYVNNYGGTHILPDRKTAVSIQLTGDNQGPHTAEQVRGIYAGLRKRYPRAKIEASTLTDVADALIQMQDRLPVVTAEIGDTWIHGMGSSPVRMACFRALSRLYGQWIADKRLDPQSDSSVCFAVQLGMIGEHTWGLDVKTHLKHWEAYDYEPFLQARNLPEFQQIEASWREIDDNLEKALAYLPADLRTEARKALDAIGHVQRQTIHGKRAPKEITPQGALQIGLGDLRLTVGELIYQTFSAEDFQRFHRTYLTSSSDWALRDFGKPGLENSGAQSASLNAVRQACDIRKTKEGKEIACGLAFEQDARVDARFYPEDMYVNYSVDPSGRKIDMAVTLFHKPINRLPEAYWLRFQPENVTKMLIEKTGRPVDVLDVVENGNRQMHGIDRYVDIFTTAGRIRITSEDALLASVGDKSLLNYSVGQPNISKGLYYCLFNNVWGTNFTMWFGGSITYRFTVELYPADPVN